MTTLTFHPTSTRSDATRSFFAFDPYIETFWLPCIGPTATWLMNHLCIRALIESNTFTMDISDLASRVGTGAREGSASPVAKQLARLCHAGVFHARDTHEYLIPKTIDPLNAFIANRLGREQRGLHDQWLNRLSISPLSTQRRRVRSLVSRLETMGVAQNTILSTVLATGLHPSIIGETIAKDSRHGSAA